jgi:isocitrate dehydrogenase
MKGNPSSIEIEGIDLFFTSELLAEEIAQQLAAILPSDLDLVSLTNRGTVVWPNGSVYTECSTGYAVRIKGVGKTKSEWWDLTNTLSSVINISSTEFLNVIDGQRAYSVGQGK